MGSYRCYFINYEDEIGLSEIIDADNPTDAIDKALAMLNARRHYSAVEVWDGEKRLYPLVRPPGPSP
jgi:hypothetical protein